mmetsp:Transcript_25141/g.42437  ORF Transcript_25141/g.42437 Transcript_25141/m.42437 type:complete len:197 (+) Transcript_25141:36-626(+)|eukprot:CAMPEP_0114436666 /NCGR_PEP_ID=MMETSP0103-20121206/13583_1 /TAXON_ID=37642 ORGANISM="Paraphysomonas imperforata, Strain PA2" /NCGR_SAMPLE_ID=MMETSP0103 /ASSEMBLY_ACC=CAM_ASM_000201 /LENGTH=196 /DNA_ID=CAMNT_0001606969 /DNA_START=36 /DNA_END=626 /DNA_ORIENTATION=+
MGVSSSTPLSAEVKGIQQWQWAQVSSSIKTYNELELPFGINASNISTISGMKEPDAEKLVHALAKQPDTGVVNALTVLAAIISLADEAAGSVDARVECLFDLIDFDYTAQVTYDELVVLFLCFGTALAGILRGRAEPPVFPDDVFCRRLAGQVYQELDKDQSDILTRSEFSAWAISFLSEIEEVNVDNVYMSLFHH